MRSLVRLWLLASCVAHAPIAAADDVLVAVAASFMPAMASLAEAFEHATEHRVEIASGSTGALYAQASQGAPFDVFVAADAERPRRLADAGIGIDATRATIAFGQLVLFSSNATLIDARGLDALRDPNVRRIAIANPRVAPYGLAAQQALEALGLWDSSSPRIVRGESVAQTFAMIATGNAELGFVALAQVIGLTRERGAYTVIPQQYYAPIQQDAIVLTRARDHAAAFAFQAFLLSEPARATLESFGYRAPQ